MPIGKTLILLGIILFATGLFFSFGGKIPFLGRLPGDIRIQRDHFSFYFPLTSSILVSILLSLILLLFRR